MLNTIKLDATVTLHESNLQITKTFYVGFMLIAKQKSYIQLVKLWLNHATLKWYKFFWEIGWKKKLTSILLSDIIVWKRISNLAIDNKS